MTNTLIPTIQKAQSLIAKLDFEGCITLYNRLDAGHPMIDLVFDRMETLDSMRFDDFLNN